MRFILVFLVLLLSGCATLFGEGADDVTIKSEPSGAKVYFNEEFVGKTPVTKSMDRSTFDQVHVRISKKGYGSKKFRLRKTLATSAIFNLSFITSWATDALTGNMIKYQPKSYFIELEGVDESASLLRRKDFQFLLVNFEQIQEQVAKGGGEELQVFHELSRPELTGAEFQLYLRQSEILSQLDAVAFYRRLR